MRAMLKKKLHECSCVISRKNGYINQIKSKIGLISIIHIVQVCTIKMEILLLWVNGIITKVDCTSRKKKSPKE